VLLRPVQYRVRKKFILTFNQAGSGGSGHGGGVRAQGLAAPRARDYY